MKNMIMLLVSAVLGVLTMLIVMTVDGRSNRSMELKSNLSSAVEETVEIMSTGKYDISNTNAFLADFTQNLSGILDSDADITVKILNVDKEKGMLGVRVTAAFVHPNGKPGTVGYERNVVLNKREETEVQTYTVQFYLQPDKIYKTYSLCEGDSIHVPENPTSESGTFTGWADAEGYLADFSQPVEQDLSYYAVWN